MSESSAYDGLWDDWGGSYGFWHDVITRPQKQIPYLAGEIRDETTPIQLLDVGCGDGTEMARVLDNVRDGVHITACDISPDALEDYRENASPALTESFCCRFEDLPARVNQQFDIVLFSHCLHDADLGSVLNKYDSLVREGGKLVVLLESKESTVVQMRKSFWGSVHGEPLTENTGEDVLLWLDGKGWEPQTTFIDYVVDLERLNKYNDDGLRELYIPFGMRTNDIDSSTERKILRFLEQKQPGNVIPHRSLAISAQKPISE